MYPEPLVNSQISGGGSSRLSRVSVETPLCVGPRKDGQSLVTASLARAFGSRCAAVRPSVVLAASADANKACRTERRDMEDINSMLVWTQYCRHSNQIRNVQSNCPTLPFTRLFQSTCLYRRQYGDATIALNRPFLTVRERLPAQPVDATQALNRSACPFADTLERDEESNA